MATSVAKFHSKVQTYWNCSNCPVCYFIKNPDFLKNSVCMDCGTLELLWFCIICGHVGCGHQVKRHALKHYSATKHRYVVGIKKFKVWDYKDKKWLHNLDQNNNQSFELLSVHSTINCTNNCSCTVCQYKRAPRLIKHFTCMKCKICKKKKLLVCLTCGHVGCNKYTNCHALKHYKSTLHPMVMHLTSLSVWNYKDQNYQRIGLHKTDSITLEDEAVANDRAKAEIDDIPENKSISETDSNLSNIRIEIISNPSEFFSKENFTTTTEMCQQQEEDILNRLDRLERQWQEFGSLTETNKKMITIEKRLLDLTDEKKVLEKRLTEHDTKLNELLTQFSRSRANSMPQKHFEPHEFVLSQDFERSTKTSILNINLASPTCSESPSNFNQDEFIKVFIAGLFTFCILRLAFLKIFESCMNLF